MIPAHTIRAWASRLNGHVVLADDADYEQVRRIWNLDVDRRPAAIVRCADAGDVARTITFARSHDLRIAVRSGGHSQAGHSMCDGGLVIDLAPINRCVVDPRRRRVLAGAGARVSTFLAALAPAGMVTPTGGCPDVGIGGLTLGGGESFLMAKFGAVCDSVLSADVVTASGDTITASAESHPDLFWALRGGGGNFGIVTAFTFRTYPSERVLSGRFVFPVGRTYDVIRTYRDLVGGLPDECQTSGGIMPSDTTPSLFIAVCHCGDSAAANQLVERWRQALRPASDDITWKPYAADLELPPIASGGTGAFLPELNDAVAEALADAFASAPPSCTAAWNDYHGAVTRLPADATAFPLRHPGFDLFSHAGWKTPDRREQALKWLESLSVALRPHARGVYINSLGEEPAERTMEAYAGNYDRLRAIKARYDRDNVFRLNHNIPPAQGNTA